MLSVMIISASAIAATIVIWKRNKAKKHIKEAVSAIVILWGAGVIQIAVALHLPISIPTDWISAFFEPIYVPIVKWVKGG